MHQIRFSLGLCPRPRWGSLTCLSLGLLNITYLLIYLTGALWLAVVGFLPRVSHDEAAVSTAVGQKSPPAGALDDSRAVRFGAQIPMITELGWLTSFIAYIQGGPKKTKPHTFVHTFAKYWPIFKIFSSEQSGENL